jgi:hypothetical protein
VVTTTNIRADSVGRGSLVIERSTLRSLPNVDWNDVFPLWGWTEVDFSRLRVGPLAWSPSSRDERRPGVQISLDPERRLTMSVGTGIDLPIDGMVEVTRHAGLLFYAFTADENRIAGRWVDGGLGSHRAEGFFCADRLRSR